VYIPWETLAWFLLFLFIIAIQVRTWNFGEGWGMMVCSYRWLRVRTISRIIAIPSFLWLMFFWVDVPGLLEGIAWVLIGLVIALFFNYEDMVTTKREEELE